MTAKFIYKSNSRPVSPVSPTCSERYHLEIGEVSDGTLFILSSGLERFGAGSDYITYNVVDPEALAEGETVSNRGGSASYNQNYPTFTALVEDNLLDNLFTVDGDGVLSDPPYGLQWDMEASHELVNA